MNDKKWLPIEEAAEYVGMGKTVLYELAREGRAPANRVGKKWLFDKEELDAWVKASRSIDAFFTSVSYDIVENPALREPQREGYARVQEHFATNDAGPAIVQLPVGCGKSGLAAILPFGISHGRVLIIAPNLTIKDELEKNLDVSDRQNCFWRKTNVLDDATMAGGPYMSTLEDGNISVIEKSHIVVTNIQQLATNEAKWLAKFDHDYFDMIIVDEAHHSPAKSWSKVIERFPKAKVVLLTATPFRSDKREVEGKLVYRYSFRSATLKGFIKRLLATYVAPIELTFEMRGETKTYSFEEIMKLKEDEMFSRGVALSPICNEHIVDASLEKLEELRLTGTMHQIIAVAISIDHAKSIRSMYEKRGYSAAVIHSHLDVAEREKIISDLRNGSLDVIVQVQMLGEGFDHKKLSVAAIFRPFRSLAPYIQFVGRILRVVVQNDHGHPDNKGHIVSHVGLNLDERLKEFQEFEKDDQAFWRRVMEGIEPEVPKIVTEGGARQRVGKLAFAHDEIVQSFVEEDFLSADDEAIQREIEAKFRALGLDPALAQDVMKKRVVRDERRIVATAGAFPVQPQSELKEARIRLNERIKSDANALVNRVDLKRAGKEIPFKLTSLGVPAQDNFIAAVIMINAEVSRLFPGKERSDLSSEECKEAMDQLPKIVKKLTARIKKAQSDHE